MKEICLNACKGGVILNVNNSVVKMSLFVVFWAIMHDALDRRLSMFSHMECCVLFIVSAPAAAEVGQ